MTLSRKSLQNNSKLTWLVEYSESKLDAEHQVTPWSESLLETVNELAQFLLSSADGKAIPEIVALAFWVRKSHLVQIEETLAAEIKQPKPVGKVFHIAPANVDTVFFYSLILSVLSGNQNIVRISNRSGDITHTLIKLINQFFELHPSNNLKQLVAVVEYDAAETELTEVFSQWADLRVVWGGDDAIHTISQIAPQTHQVVFPDRYSVAVIHLQSREDIPKAVDALLTDLLPFRQQACSSPKALLWWHTEPQLQQAFWHTLAEKAAQHPQQFSMSDHVEQIINSQRLLMLTAIQSSGLESFGGIRVMSVNQVIPEQLALHSGFGLLLSSELQALDKLPFADKCQTVSVFGLTDQELDILASYQVEGRFKRSVNLGQSLVFKPVWDGVDLPLTFSCMELNK